MQEQHTKEEIWLQKTRTARIGSMIMKVQPERGLNSSAFGLFKYSNVSIAVIKNIAKNPSWLHLFVLE